MPLHYLTISVTVAPRHISSKLLLLLLLGLSIAEH